MINSGLSQLGILKFLWAKGQDGEWRIHDLKGLTLRLFGLIGLSQDSLLVLRREDPPLGNGDDLRVGALRADRGRFGLASLCSQGWRICFRVLHAEFPSRPAL